MNDTRQSNIDEADIEYTIVVKTCEDILSELTDDINERLIYESIIDGIEHTASETIRADKIAQLPSIGCLRKNPIRKVIKDNQENFRIARKNMTTSQYREHVREVIIDTRETQAKEEFKRIIIRKIRIKNKKKYDKLYINIGKAYAEMFIHSILYLSEVPYNSEVQEHFDNLNNL